MPKFLKITFIILGLFIVAILAILVYLGSKPTEPKYAEVDFSCVEIEKHKITGHSLRSLLEEGTEVEGWTGYYECNPIKKGEVAILKFKTREETFVKKIAGLPGDEIEFVDNQMKLNGEILKNSAGEIYLFSERSQKLLSIPLKDGKIPEGRYLVLSEGKGPSAFDSRQYGFVQKEHLKGKVVW